MANTVANVLSGKPLTSGGLLVAPLGTALPTAASSTPNAAFKAAGYISEDGVTEGTERSTDKIVAWGGDTVKVTQTEYSVTYEFTFIEAFNADVLAAVYGDDNVTTTAATGSTGTLHTVKLNSEQLPHKRFLIEIKDGDAKIRIVIPDGQVTEVGEITYNDSDVVGYPVTVEAFFDSGLDANVVKYMDDGVFAA